MRRMVRSISMSPRSSSQRSRDGLESKWSSIALRPVAMTMMIWSIPEAAASSTAYWMIGRSTSGIISLGMALRRREEAGAEARRRAGRPFGRAR